MNCTAGETCFKNFRFLIALCFWTGVNVTAFVQSAFASDEKMSNFQKEFLIEKEAKIRFLAWPGSSEFELTFQQADELGYRCADQRRSLIKAFPFGDQFFTTSATFYQVADANNELGP